VRLHGTFRKQGARVSDQNNFSVAGSSGQEIDEECLDYLSDHQLLKNYCSPWSQR